MCHVTPLLTLLDKMYKYEIDPASIMEDIEQTQFHPQTDRQTDGWIDKQGETSIPRFQLHWSGGIINISIISMHRFVWNDSETHETVLLDCTTSEAGSAIQYHQLSAFHCYFIHTCAFSLLSHTYCVQTQLRWLWSNEFNIKSYL